MKNKKFNKNFFEKLNNLFLIAKSTEDFELVKSNDIISKCILIENKNLFFVSPFVNGIHS